MTATVLLYAALRAAFFALGLYWVIFGDDIRRRQLSRLASKLPPYRAQLKVRDYRVLGGVVIGLSIAWLWKDFH